MSQKESDRVRVTHQLRTVKGLVRTWKEKRQSEGSPSETRKRKNLFEGPSIVVVGSEVRTEEWT